MGSKPRSWRSHKARGASRRMFGLIGSKPQSRRSHKACGASRRITSRNRLLKAPAGATANLDLSPLPGAPAVSSSFLTRGLRRRLYAAAAPAASFRRCQACFQADTFALNVLSHHPDRRASASSVQSRGAGDRIERATRAAGSLGTSTQSRGAGDRVKPAARAAGSQHAID
ncbi:hypothetical protein CA51_30110 [Rosistilla oblonga]|nr:hypothetical protein CA51_30110 [Rosistilla oblonga]